MDEKRTVTLEDISVLAVRNLSYSYGKHKVLDKVNLDLGSHTYALLGPNGSGKTTLIRCLTLIFPEVKDRISFNGAQLKNEKNYKENLGYLSQNFNLFPELTLREALSLLANYKGIKKSEIADEVRIAAKQVNLDDVLDKKLGAFSGGMVRRAGVAQALLNEPKVLIFDEPTSGLDIEERIRFKSLIAGLTGERTILISTHIVADVEAVCDQILVMKEGQILGPFTQEALADFAENKVYIVPERDLDLLQEPYFMKNKYVHEGVTHYRCLSATTQNIMASKPQLEDGYLCLLKEI